MGLLKKTMTIEAAMRLTLAAAVRRDVDAALAEIATARALSPADMARVKAELPAFAIAIWHLLFLEHAPSLGAQDVTRRFTVALALAHKDAGLQEQQIDMHVESLMDSALAYLEHLSQVPSDRLESDGAASWYCQHFTSQVLPELDPRHESNRDRHFQVFDIANQDYHAAKAAFDEILRQYRLEIS